MAVIPSVSHSQSSDGKTLTILDTSDYSTGDINNYTRKVQLWSGINGSGTMITEIPFDGVSLELTYAITADQYFSAKLIFTGSPAVASVYANFTPQQFEQNALNALLNKNCGCGTTKTCGKSTMGFIYLVQSQLATLAGNSGLANSFIQSSLKWLNS